VRELARAADAAARNIARRRPIAPAIVTDSLGPSASIWPQDGWGFPPREGLSLPAKSLNEKVVNSKQILAVGAAAALTMFASPGVAQPARKLAQFVCVNPSSGATWKVQVDYDRNQVDGFPATISRDLLAWRDASQGGYYELDLATGALTARFASSTGGYFLHDHCSAER
jgi:hypothetical protein